MYTQLDLSKVVSLRGVMASISGLKEFFGLDAGPMIGLDIGSTAVKLLKMSKHHDRIRVENFAVVPLAPGIVLENNITNQDTVVSAIQLAIKNSGIKTFKACISIPNSMAVTKVVQMARGLTDKEIASEIEIDSNKYIPYPLSEINLDYVVLGPKEDNQEINNVLVVATKSENIDNLVRIVVSAGLVPTIVDIDGYAVARAFELMKNKLPAHGQNKIIAIVDIGATLTTLNIIDQDNVVYMREQAFGSQQLIDEIQNIYGLNYDEAILAMRYENLPKDFYLEVLEPFKQTVAQQIERFCQFFFAAGEYHTIDYIFLTGGCAGIFGLDKVIQDRLQIKTFVANPFDDLTLASNINKDAFNEVSLRLMKCCGLALRNIS